MWTKYKTSESFLGHHLALGQDAPGAGRLGPVITGRGAGSGGAVSADTAGLGAVTTGVTPGPENQKIVNTLASTQILESVIIRGSSPGDDVAVAAGACWLAAVPALGLDFAEQGSQQTSLGAGLD